MDSIGKRLLLSAGIGLGVAVSGVSLYLLFKDNDSLESDEKKRSVTTSHQSMTTISVPKECVGAVIGRGGEQVKKIQTDTKTRIHFEDNNTNGINNDNNARYLVIKGLPENIAKAEMAINEIITEQSLITTKKFLIPYKTVGSIIGRNGDNIRYLCDKSGAKIVVAKTNKKPEDMNNCLNPISITGTDEQLSEARRLIDAEIERFTRNRSHSSHNQMNPLNATNLVPIEDNVFDSEHDFDSYFAKLEPNDSNLTQVFVSAVKSPNLFYIQLAGHKGIQLDHLMDETTDFYEVEENRICFKPNEVKVGDIMAAPYAFDEHWYRVRITSVEENPYSLEESKVGIFYLDYGDEAVVQYKQICVLKEELLRRLAFQAIECSLSGIVPKFQVEWSEAAVDSFKELTHMALWKTIYANLSDVRVINGKKERHFIELIDINPESKTSNASDDDWNQSSPAKPLNIGEEMIRKGFCVRIESNSSET